MIKNYTPNIHETVSRGRGELNLIKKKRKEKMFKLHGIALKFSTFVQFRTYNG